MKPPAPPKPDKKAAAPPKPDKKAEAHVRDKTPNVPPEVEEVVVIQPGLDPFSNSEKVFGLNKNNYWPFLTSKDVAMVLFYNTDHRHSTFVRNRYTKAAENTTRSNHAFAAVDCMKDESLCTAEGVKGLPVYKLYSKGQLLRTITDYSEITTRNLETLVDKTPVLHDFVALASPCKK